MKQLFDHYDEYGNPVDRYGNVITDMAQDGQSIRVPLMMMDEQQRAIATQDAKKVTIEMTPAKVQAAVTKHLPGYQLVKQEALMKQETKQTDDYQQGLRDAESDTGQGAYEQRVSNAWRDGAIPASLEDDYGRGVNDACHEAAWAEERRIADVQKDYVTRVTEAWR